MFKILALINKVILPSFSKQQMDLAKAKWQWQSLAPLLCDHKGGVNTSLPKNIISLFFSSSVRKPSSIRKLLTISPPIPPPLHTAARFLQRGHHHE
jgi:hypothetical protein